MLIEILLFKVHYLGYINTKKGKENKFFSIKIKINLDSLLKKSKLSEYYDLLFNDKESEGLLYGKTREEIESTLDTKLRDYGFTHLNFDIINETVFFNNKPVISGRIYGSVFIPYDNQTDSMFEFITAGLSIRAVVINGILKIQIGRFVGDYDKNELWKDIAQLPLSIAPYLYPMSFLQFNVQNDVLYEDGKEQYHSYFSGILGSVKRSIFERPANYLWYKYNKMIRKIGKGGKPEKIIKFFRKDADRIPDKLSLEYQSGYGDRDENVYENKYVSVFLYHTGIYDDSDIYLRKEK